MAALYSVTGVLEEPMSVLLATTSVTDVERSTLCRLLKR
jgi:hypothetical protein